MSQVRQLNPVPPSFDALLSDLVANLASQQSDKILAELKTLISKEFAEVRSNIIERPMDHSAMSEFLGIHQNTLYIWIREGIVPPEAVHRLHGKNYYFPSEVVKHIKKS